MAKNETVLEMLGEYLRELSVLVLVFFPLELSKGGDVPRQALKQVAEFSFGTLLVGIVFSKSTTVKVFVKRVFSALWNEFFPKEAKKNGNGTAKNSS